MSVPFRDAGDSRRAGATGAWGGWSRFGDIAGLLRRDGSWIGLVVVSLAQIVGGVQV